MHNSVRKQARTAFVTFVSAVTTLWSVGITAFVPVASAQTTVVMSGDNIKVLGDTAVYFVSGTCRYTWPHAGVFKGWYKDYSAVKTVSDAVLNQYQNCGPAPARDGFMFRGTAQGILGLQPNAVFVTAGNRLYDIVSGDFYKSATGDQNYSRTTWVPDDLLSKFTYAYGAKWQAGTWPNDIHPGAVVKYAADPSYYVITSSGKRAMSASALEANGYDMSKVITVAAGKTWADAAAGPVTGREAALADPTPTSSTPVAPSPAPAPAGGGLNVSVSSSNPAGGTLPTKADGVPLFAFDLRAVSGATTVTGVEVHRAGVGAVGDFDNIYLYDGMKRLTSGRTIASSTHVVAFGSLNLAIGAGETKSLTVRGDVNTSATSGNEHLFEVASAAAVTSNGTVSGSFPVRGNLFKIGGQGVSTLTVDNGTNPGNPSIGAKNAPLATVKFSTTGTTPLDVQRISLTQSGTVSNSDLANLSLERSGKVVATTAALDGDKLTFVFNPVYRLPEGQTHEFNLKGDVGGRSGRTIIFYVEYNTDVYAIDTLYNSGADIGIADIDTSAEGTSVTTQGGKVTIAYIGPSAKDAANGSKDVELYRFSMTTQEEAVEVKDLDIRLRGTAGTAGHIKGSSSTNYFTDIKVVDADSGKVLMGPLELSSAKTAKDGSTAIAASATAGFLGFTDSWVLSGKTTKTLSITADLTLNEDAAADRYFAEPFDVTLQAWDATDVREVSTSVYLAASDIVPSSAVEGNDVTVQAPALTVKLGSQPTSSTVVRSQQAWPSWSETFEAGRNSDIKITQIVLTGQGAFDADSSGAVDAYAVGSLDDIILSATLWDGETQVGTAKSPSTTGTLTFDSLNWVIPKGVVKRLTVKANVATTITNLSAVNATAWLGINAATDISAFDLDSNSVTPTDGDSTWSGPINSTPTTVLTVRNAGSLTAQDVGEPLSDLVLGGASGVTFTKIRFTSQYEETTVTRLQVKTATATDDELSNVVLEYPGPSGTTVTKSGFVDASLTANFNDLNFVIGKDTSVTLVMKGNLAAVGNDGSNDADSGAEPLLTMDFDTNFESVGKASGTTSTTIGSADIAGRAMTVRKAKPVFTVATSSSTLSNGSNKEVYRFTVAAEGGDVSLKKLSFSVAMTDISGSDLKLDTLAIYDAANISTELTTTAGGNFGIEDSSGNSLKSTTTQLGSGTTTVIVSLDSEKTVQPGSPVTFVLKGRVVGVASTGDTISTSLTNTNDTATLTRFLVGRSVSASNNVIRLGTTADGTGTNTSADLIWSDRARASHSDNAANSGGSTDWSNGRFLKNLSGSVTMSL